MAAELTPMMRQYLAIKREVPAGAIVMFRLGDFYEMFGEDAIVASPILGATLTQRNGQPMCGVPYHAINSYLAKLIRAGKTAALCDQVEDPKTAKGLVRREVTRIVTPGTVTEDGLLDETRGNYVAAVSGLALALLDLSTGEFAVEPCASQPALDEALERYAPAEVLRPTDENGWTFSPDAATECLTRHFKVLSLDGFGLAGRTDLVSAAGALLYYVGTTLRHALGHVRKVQLRQAGDGLVLDAGTLRHLQLLPCESVAKEASLLGVLDVTKTPMGARTLRNWIARPLARAADVNARLDAVQAFVGDRASLAALRALLAGVRDLERLVAKVDSGRANPRDLRGLAASLRPIPEILAKLSQMSNASHAPVPRSPFPIPHSPPPSPRPSRSSTGRSPTTRRRFSSTAASSRPATTASSTSSARWRRKAGPGSPNTSRANRRAPASRSSRSSTCPPSATSSRSPRRPSRWPRRTTCAARR